MPTEERINKITKTVAQRQSGLIVVLEDITDPHNAQAVFRTCEAYGIQKVVLIFKEQEEFAPTKMGRASSSSANKWLDFDIYDSPKKALKDLKKQGYKIVATLLDETAESLFEADLTQDKVALMFGNEHAGLSDEAIKLADRKLYIPMRGLIQSLNLSVTAATFIFEVTRQRMQTGKDYALSKADQNKLIQDLLERKS